MTLKDMLKVFGNKAKNIDSPAPIVYGIVKKKYSYSFNNEYGFIEYFEDKNHFKMKLQIVTLAVGNTYQSRGTGQIKMTVKVIGPHETPTIGDVLSGNCITANRDGKYYISDYSYVDEIFFSEKDLKNRIKNIKKEILEGQRKSINDSIARANQNIELSKKNIATFKRKLKAGLSVEETQLVEP